MVHQQNATSDEKVAIWHRVFGIDLRTLAVFRIAIAAVLCGDMIERLWHVRFYYTDEGLLPSSAIDELFGSAIKWTSLHYHTGGSVWLQASLVGLGVVAAFCMAIGYRTRLMTILSWLLFISLNRRVSSMCTGGDDLMRLMLFWSIFLPLGARWSVDVLKRGPLEGQENQGHLFFSAGTVAILLQLCYVYFFTAIFKVMSPTWYSGTAVQDALQYELHVRPLGHWLSQYQGLLVLLTYATLVAEFLVPILVFSPIKNATARCIGVTTMVSFHLGILMCLRIGTFPFVCMACWLIFLPGETWDWLGFRAKREIAPQSIARAKLTRSWWESSDSAAAMVITLLLFVTVYNVLTLQPSKKLLNPIKKIAKYSRLDQEWKMYVRFPDDGWFVMPCQLADGTTYDIYRNEPVNYQKPKILSAEFPTARTKKLFLDHRVMRDGSASRLWEWVLRYYTNEWNLRHPDRQVARAQFAYIYEKEHEGPARPYPYMAMDVASNQFVKLDPDDLIGVAGAFQ